jgi:hypothetical protein
MAGKTKYKGIIGVADYATGEYSWRIEEAQETGIVSGDVSLLRIGSVYVEDSPNWHEFRVHAVCDVLRELRSLRDVIERQIAVIEEAEVVE